MKNYLFVIAHSDDEILGAGATILKLIEQGNIVNVACLTMEAPTREDPIINIMKDMHKKIGINKTYVYPAKALEIEKVNRIDIVQFLENIILETQTDVVFTHFKHDLHHDHRFVYEITMEAIRLPQRQPEKAIKKIKEVYCFEVPCSSTWSDCVFKPNAFVNIRVDFLDEKIKLLKMYQDVIRKKPHPRSEENIFAIACQRGSQSNCNYAEAFEQVFKLME